MKIEAVIDFTMKETAVTLLDFSSIKQRKNLKGSEQDKKLRLRNIFSYFRIFVKGWILRQFELRVRFWSILFSSILRFFYKFKMERFLRQIDEMEKMKNEVMETLHETQMKLSMVNDETVKGWITEILYNVFKFLMSQRK